MPYIVTTEHAVCSHLRYTMCAICVAPCDALHSTVYYPPSKVHSSILRRILYWNSIHFYHQVHSKPASVQQKPVICIEIGCFYRTSQYFWILRTFCPWRPFRYDITICIVTTTKWCSVRTRHAVTTISLHIVRCIHVYRLLNADIEWTIYANDSNCACIAVRHTFYPPSGSRYWTHRISCTCKHCVYCVDRIYCWYLGSCQ